MPFTAEDFMREHARNVIERSTPEERLRGLASEERVRGLAPEEVFRSLTPEARAQLEALVLANAKGKTG